MRIGDTVKLPPALAKKYGVDDFVVCNVEEYTGGVQLEGLIGVTFGEDDVKLIKGVAGELRTIPPIATDESMAERALALRAFKETLPQPQLTGNEIGSREMSFYRMPVFFESCCFCGKPIRETLDGVMCEDGHKRSD